MDKRKLEENIFKVAMVFSAAVLVGCLTLILGVIILKGVGSMSIAMLTQAPKAGYYLGAEGGILNAILGSFYMASAATFFAVILSMPLVLYLNVFRRKKSRLAGLMRFCLDVLWGIPSIVYGIFGFIIMVFFGLKASLLAGIIALTFLEFPIAARAIDEAVRATPDELKEASFAVGATKTETAFGVVLRQASGGIATAVLLSFGRGIGDAASVMFTAGFTDSIPTSLFQPVATLPLAIFYQLGTPYPKVQERAYASALVLTIIILFVSIVSRLISKRFSRHVI